MISILSPHPDDAVLSAWKVLETAPTIHVITVFDGDPPEGPVRDWDALTLASDRLARAAERRAEDAAVLQGRAGLSALAFVDAQYRDTNLEERVLLSALREALRSAKATSVLAPAAIGGHPDHVLLRNAALALAKEGWAVSFYADLPYAARCGWPRWVSGQTVHGNLAPEQDWRGPLEVLAAHNVGQRPVVQELTLREQDRKLTALRRYKTQYAALSRGPVKRLERRWFLRREVIWH